MIVSFLQIECNYFSPFLNFSVILFALYKHMRLSLQHQITIKIKKDESKIS
jgi:hypothetical protein